MNEDLKAYIDGELPPDAMDRLRTSLEANSELAREAEEFLSLSAALRSLPRPEPVGQEATLSALKTSRPNLIRTWGLSLAACALVIFTATWISDRSNRGIMIPASWHWPKSVRPSTVEVKIPMARRDAFIRFIHDRGGMISKDGNAILAFYPQDSLEELRRRFELPESTPWSSAGLRVVFTR